jgi:hypothetical protein
MEKNTSLPYVMSLAFSMYISYLTPPLSTVKGREAISMKTIEISIE